MRELEVFIRNEILDEHFIGTAIRTFREAGVRDMRVASCNGDRVSFRVQLDDPVDESALRTDETVIEFRRLAQSAPEYLLVATVPDTFFEDCPVSLVCGPGVSICEDGIKLSLIAPQSVIERIGSQLGDSDFACEVLSIGEYRGSIDGASNGLTARQRTIIMHAYQKGYYEIPRRTTLSELANDLGIDESTVAEHIQRAEKNVLGHALD